MSLTHVPSADDAEGDAWALARHDVAAGVVAVSVPHGTSSLTSLALEIADGLGIEIEANPYHRPRAHLLELVGARLRAHRIRDLIVVHGDWLPRAVVNDFARWVTLLGLRVVVVTHPPVGVDGWLEGWRSEELGWSAFVAAWTAGEPERTARRADTGRHQRVALPSLSAPPGSRSVAVPSGLTGAAALTAYAQVGAALRGTVPSMAQIASILRSVLRPCESADELAAILPGIARALADAGLGLRVSPARFGGPGVPAVAAPGEPVWADLRRSGDPAAAAAIALLGAEVPIDGLGAVRRSDVAADAAWVFALGRRRPLPAAARPFLVAMHEIRLADGAGPDDPFLARRGRPISIPALVRLVCGTLTEVGVPVDAAALRRRLGPSERWLRERGIVVTGIRIDGDHAAARAIRACRHGLPATVPVAGANLCHSQRLCRAVTPGDTRPAIAGYTLEPVEDSALGTAYRVTRDGEPAGHVWRIDTVDGPAWLEIGTAVQPAIETITAAVREGHPRCRLAGSDT